MTNRTVSRTVLIFAFVFLVASSAFGAGNSKCVFAYIAAHNPNTVSVVDTSTNTVVDTVLLPGPNAASGAGLEGVGITPDGKFVYVANLAGLVSVINTLNDHVIATINVPVGAYGLAVTPDGRFVYVASQTSNLVSVIATSTNTVVTTISIPNPLNIVAGQSNVHVISNGDTKLGTFVYVVSPFDPGNLSGGGSVSAIDTSSNTVVTTVQLPNNPSDIAVSAGGRHAYVTAGSGASANTSIVDFISSTVVASFGFFAFGTQITIEPNGLFVYLGRQSTLLVNTETLLQPGDSWSTLIDVGGRFAFTPDRKFAYTSSGGIVRILDNAIIAKLPITGSEIGVAVSPITVGCWTLLNDAEIVDQ